MTIVVGFGLDLEFAAAAAAAAAAAVTVLGWQCIALQFVVACLSVEWDFWVVLSIQQGPF